MQDIADACGLSRNTVSKIFNGRGAVPDSTRDLVLAKALDLGYRQFAAPEAPVVNPSNLNIALLTHSRPQDHSFGSLFITNFTDQICRSGYNLKIFEINEEDLHDCRLPSHFSLTDVSGIVAIELFDRDYTQMLSDLPIPLLLVDSCTPVPGDFLQCDIVYMESYASAIAITYRMIAAGAKTIGFVGDANHCKSFFDRWYGYQTALANAQLAVDPSVCILADDSEPYGEVGWLQEQLASFPYIPEAFVCANDFIAIRLMQALRKMGLSIPEDVMVSGFDGSPAAEVVSPALTTAIIPSAEIGRVSANILTQRIASPYLPYGCTFISTTPVWRESTRS